MPSKLLINPSKLIPQHGNEPLQHYTIFYNIMYSHVSGLLECVYSVLVPVQNSTVQSSLPISIMYSVVPVPTKVCHTCGGVYGHYWFIEWIVGFCWILLCFLHQEQRERLASQGSILSNGGEDLYASINETVNAVSPLSTEICRGEFHIPSI